MKEIKFDFNNLFSFAIGAKHGITETEFRSILPAASKAHAHLQEVINCRVDRVRLSLEWAALPFQKKQSLVEIKNLGKEIAAKYQNVIFLGIGGSYLGLKAAQDALAQPYYNEFLSLRKKSPRIYFEGNNLDPDTLAVLLKNLNPKRTFVVVISKSGETTETKAGFSVVEAWLRKAVGKFYGRQILAITDPISGSLRAKINREQARDELSFRSLPLLKGVGGRFSEFNMGLLHLAILGVDLEKLLSGARDMAIRCSHAQALKNPAYLYACLHYLLYKKKGKSIAVLMPFSESLKSSADWYVQLLAESLGKKYARKVISIPGLGEQWALDKTKLLNVGRTPIACRGTNDLHSLQQNNIEGENNKAVTFIRVEKFRHELSIPADGDLLSGRVYSRLLSLAQEATEWALVQEQRPNCTIILPELNAYYWGALLFFFEMATAFEGELLGINAFDQPGVEGYKNYMYYKLRKPGIPEEIARKIKAHPLKKKKRLII